MTDEDFEAFFERLENLVLSMQGRIEKLEERQAAADKNAPFHIGTPMKEYAERQTVGFKGNPWTPMPRESEPQL